MHDTIGPILPKNDTLTKDKIFFKQVAKKVVRHAVTWFACDPLLGVSLTDGFDHSRPFGANCETVGNIFYVATAEGRPI